MDAIQLKVNEHSRDIAGLRYVYPVVSRRAGGVSVGINLNTNNACNWRCVYCQVPGLKLGMAPAVDLTVLEQELRGFLHELVHGDFMRKSVPEEARRINDIALSGNGEPTSAAEFEQVIQIVGRVKRDLHLPEHIKLLLITNGSLLQRQNVQRGLRLMAGLNGEVWLKLDRASERGMLSVNDTHTSLASAQQNVITAISCCPNTWLQTCWFAMDGHAPSTEDEQDYLRFINELLRQGILIQGVLLYGIARPSLQPEAPRLKAVATEQLVSFAGQIRALGITVKVSE